MRHEKYTYVKKLVENDITTLLEGQAGSGKSTIAKQVAEDLGLDFYTVTTTKQTTVNSLLGFISVSGTYIPSQLRLAFENGGMFLIDEINAADPNVLLALNSIENGYLAFPDAVVEKHKDFRLIAAANPADSAFTGRSKLDFATLDRFYTVTIERDHKLELELTSEDTIRQVETARELYLNNGISKPITMRDAIRVHKLATLDVTETAIKDVCFSTVDTFDLYTEFEQQMKEKEKEEELNNLSIDTAKTVKELWTAISKGETEFTTNLSDTRKLVVEKSWDPHPLWERIKQYED